MSDKSSSGSNRATVPTLTVSSILGGAAAVQTLVNPNASAGLPIVTAVLCAATGVVAFHVLRTATTPRRRLLSGAALALVCMGVVISGIVGLTTAISNLRAEPTPQSTGGPFQPPVPTFNPSPTLSPSSSPSSSPDAPPRPNGYPATVTHGNPDAAGDVPVIITIARPAEAGRTYWLFAYLPNVDPKNPHPLYYELDRLGSRNGPYQYQAVLGNTPPGSERMYVVYEVDDTQDKKLKGLLGNKGAAWDMRRLQPPCNCQASEKHLVKTLER